MPHYWFDVFTVQSWEEAEAYGFSVTGFSESKRASVEKIKADDILICYLKGKKKLVGAFRAVGEPYFSQEPKIWADADFPARIHVEPIVTLKADEGYDFDPLLQRMSVYNPANLKSTWARFQGSPTLLVPSDGEMLLAAILDSETLSAATHQPIPPVYLPKKDKKSSASVAHIPTSRSATLEPPIKILTDPLSALSDELTKAQRDVTHPGRFEQAVADAFQFLGLDSTRYGQPNKTDVIVNSHLGHDRFRAVIDAKASSNGKVPEGQINWTAVANHRHQAQADYAVVVGEKFAGGNLQRFATESSISLIETGQLVEVLRLHARTPFPAADLRELFSTSGPVSVVLTDLQQKSQTIERHWNLVAEIIRLVVTFSKSDPPLMPTTGNLHAVLVARALSANGGNISPPAEQDVRDAVAFLASRSMGVLRVVDAETSGYRLATSEHTALRRLQAIDATIHGIITEDASRPGKGSQSLG